MSWCQAGTIGAVAWVVVTVWTAGGQGDSDSDPGQGFPLGARQDSAEATLNGAESQSPTEGPMPPIVIGLPVGYEAGQDHRRPELRQPAECE